MQEVWFIRHGESMGNTNNPTTVPNEITLTPRGHEQAHYIAHCLPKKPLLIVTSPYERARQTARPTIQRFQDVVCEEWDVYEFTYLRTSSYRLTTQEQRKSKVNAFWNKSEPTYRDSEEVESFFD